MRRHAWMAATAILAAAVGCGDAGRGAPDAIPDLPVADTPSDTVGDAPSDTVGDAPSDTVGDAPSDTVGDAPGDAPRDAADIPGEVPTPASCRTPALANASLPAGYCAWVFATGLSTPRGLFVASNGDALVVERGEGRVTALWDADGDGRSGDSERAVIAAADGLNHGIAVSGAHLYASTSVTVYRWVYGAGERKDLGAREEVVRGIPGGGHSTRTLVFDAEGRMYVAVGSQSNLDPDASRAKIKRFPADRPAGGVDWDTGEDFAVGLRNEVGLAFDAAGRLWGVENGSDNLSRDDLGGDIHLGNPAEELNLFAEPGRFYGYPYCFTEMDLPAGVGGGPGTQWAYGHVMDDGTHTDAWCRDPANVVPPRFWMDAHTAPLGIVFYDGGLFPADARGDAFVPLHGSWNDNPPTGYKVVRIRFQGGEPATAEPIAVEPFLESAGPGDTGGGWAHRPVDAKVAADGTLLVTSDASDVVIAVGYGGL